MPAMPYRAALDYPLADLGRAEHQVFIAIAGLGAIVGSYPSLTIYDIRAAPSCSRRTVTTRWSCLLRG